MRKKMVMTLACMLIMLLGMVMTPSSVAHWTPADGHKMHWPQTPDLTDEGVAVDMPLAQVRGDDFLCTQTGYINDIHIWAAFQNDELPHAGAGGLLFDLYIYSNLPPNFYPNLQPWSMPGDLLWYKRATSLNYSVIAFTMTDPMDWLYPIPSTVTPDTHKDVYQYNFHFDNSEAFLQEEGTTYWLVIRQYFTSSGEHFGWMAAERDLQWNDNAVMPAVAPWNWEPMEYPNGDPLDLAFVINGVEVIPPLPIGPVQFNPRHLNLRSNGRWVTVSLLPEPKDEKVADIVLSSVLLADSIPVDWGRLPADPLGLPVDPLGKQHVMLKFNRADLEDLILGRCTGAQCVRLKISGLLADGTPFEGYTTPITYTGLE